MTYPVRLVFPIWIVLLHCFFSVRCNAQDIIFSKPIAGGTVLTVSRKSIPYVTPPALKVQEKQLPPGDSFTYPSYRYLYSFIVTSKKRTTLFWSHPVDSFEELPSGPGPLVVSDVRSTNIVVLDAVVEDKFLIVVYKQGRSVIANVINSSITGPGQAMAWPDANILGDTEFIDHATTIMSAKIEGSLKKENLGVTFSDQDGNKYLYLYHKGKWMKEVGSHKAL